MIQLWPRGILLTGPKKIILSSDEILPEIFVKFREYV